MQALRQAFDAMVKDPEFIADAQKLRVELGPLPGTELQQIVAEVAGMPPDIVGEGDLCPRLESKPVGRIQCVITSEAKRSWIASSLRSSQ